jgi:hypothetical protein|tara:strand:+ start:2841 stop:3038 length:198 start_codon:yes stop_codon:yes gene_type:complete
MTYLELADFILKKMPKEYRDLDVAGSVSWGFEDESKLSGSLYSVSVLHHFDGVYKDGSFVTLEFN